jgi:hypothetical protein
VCDLDDPRADEHLTAALYQFAYIIGSPAPIEPAINRGLDVGWHDLQPDERLASKWSGWTYGPAGALETLGQPRISVVSIVPTESTRDVAVALPSMSFDALPGWMLIRHGDARGGPGPVRLYANTRPAGARAVLRALVSELLAEGFDRFSMKFLTGRDHLSRADSTVIYLPELPTAALLDRLATALHPAIAAETVPMLTHRYSPGIAIAHSPSTGGSFGELRCGQIATTAISRLKGVERADLPFDPDAPWNDPGTPALEHHVGTSRQSPATRALPSAERSISALAAELVGSAIIASGMATWLRRDTATGREITTGADVYAGSAGALAVLAHAVRLHGAKNHTAVLRATARAMLARQGDLPRDGFHAGQPGTAAALAEAAILSGDDEMRAIAEASLARAARANTVGSQWDVISGTAGTILGLNAAATFLELKIPADMSCLRDHLAFRHELDPLTGGAKWRSQIGRRRPALAGLAHGASGAALAVAVASGATDAVPIIVEGAAAFEDGSRASEIGWVDHRVPGASTAAVAWCHGAGGIGVVSAALDLRYPGRFDQRARLAATRIRESLTGFVADAGLCHGASGRALALAVIASTLGNDRDRQLAREVFERLPKTDVPRDVGLMTGEPGVVVAQLAVEQLAPAPIAFVLDPLLVRAAVHR